MGGGAAMRTVAKGAVIGVVNSGFRGAVSGLPPAEHSVRSASRPVSAAISSSASASGVAAVHQRPVWELDEWEFAGAEEEEELALLESLEPKPRLVFGGPPTSQEAKEATAELKDALEKISSPTHGGSGHLSHPLLATSEMEANSCLSCERKAGPEYAIKALKLLNQSPAAQSVVVSIASDPNVWDAVMRNDALTEFLQSHKTTASPMIDESSTESVTDSSSEYTESAASEESSQTGFMAYLEDIKVKVVDMFGTVSSFVQNMLGGSPPAAGESAETGEGNEKSSTFAENAVGASFLGLAVMAIMMVVLRRV